MPASLSLAVLFALCVLWSAAVTALTHRVLDLMQDRRAEGPDLVPKQGEWLIIPPGWSVRQVGKDELA